MDILSSLGGIFAAWMALILVLGLVFGGLITIAIVAWPVIGLMLTPLQAANRSPSREDKYIGPPKATTDE